MSSVNKETLLEELRSIGKGEMEFYLYERIMHESVIKEYSSWILCCGISSSDDLNKEWENIVDCFAVYFQTTLPSEIERSNLYIIFFIGNEVSNELKMKIEYDRYSSRKIIVTEKYPKSDSDKEKIVDNLIFTIGDYQENAQTETLNNWLENNEPILSELYQRFINGVINIEDAFSEYSNL